MKRLKKSSPTENKSQPEKQETKKETYATGTASPAAKKILAEKEHGSFNDKRNRKRW